MSQESYEWLNNNVLAGFTLSRMPWWAKDIEGHSNLFDAEVPMERVEELLCSWQPEVGDLSDVNYDNVQTLYDADMKPIQAVAINDITSVNTHKLVKASDTHEHIAVVGIDRAMHTYHDWLTGTVKETVGDEAQVSSAGLLRNRAQAWVQIERPESAVGPDGIKFSPFICLSTSLDSSLASQINQNTRMVICDNTLEVGRGQGLAARVKHTSNSGSKLGAYRGVMMALMQGETDFREELERELAVEVPDNAFQRFLDAFIPESDDDKPAKRTRSKRMKQDITELYHNDPRAASWRGREFGVVQAVNTYQTHLSQLRNATGYEMDDTNLRAMRNYAQLLKPVKGESSDEKTIRILEGVL